MRGRKPIYSQEECQEMARRVAAGESPTAIGKAMGKDKPIPRTSVLQCVKSARLSSELREQVVMQLKTKELEKVLTFFRRGREEVLRRIQALAVKADEKGTLMLAEALEKIAEASEKIKTLAPIAAPATPGRRMAATDETRLIFERGISIERVSVAPAKESAPSGLGGSNPDAAPAPAVETEAGTAEPSEAA